MKIKSSLNIILSFSILLQLLSLPGCVFAPFTSKFDAEIFLNSNGNILDNSSQVLLVKDNSFLFFTRTKLYALEKSGKIWKTSFDPFNAVIGKNGFAPAGEKKEGDGKTPSGIFSLKLAFGYPESVNTKMPYRQALPDDIWVDDPNANDYNHWTKKQKTLATSYEMMKREDNLYKFGVVIEYNTSPVIKGKGSAIFLHIWKGKDTPTAGCVAVSEENILKILEWLDPAKSPVIITGNTK
ncbi:MAG: L,D-transpeptidase family protein [Syntrophaceae bacterium]|nr:L,D-transpeptidase family protein [Syntrophaceae bacterium]